MRHPVLHWTKTDIWRQSQKADLEAERRRHKICTDGGGRGWDKESSNARLNIVIRAQAGPSAGRCVDSISVRRRENRMREIVIQARDAGMGDGGAVSIWSASISTSPTANTMSAAIVCC